jgi:hypothetical protein
MHLRVTRTGAKASLLSTGFWGDRITRALARLTRLGYRLRDLHTDDALGGVVEKTDEVKPAKGRTEGENHDYWN